MSIGRLAELRLAERAARDHVENEAVDLGSYRLHEVESQGLASFGVRVDDPEPGVERLGCQEVAEAVENELALALDLARHQPPCDVEAVWLEGGRAGARRLRASSVMEESRRVRPRRPSQAPGHRRRGSRTSAARRG